MSLVYSHYRPGLLRETKEYVCKPRSVRCFVSLIFACVKMFLLIICLLTAACELSRK
jgi:hypothetical protein